MTKNNDKPGQDHEDTEGKFKFVFDASTGESKRVKLTEEELTAFEPVTPPEVPPGSVDKEALAKAIDECKNLERLKDLLIRDILPLL